jgi:hypothetical protein
MRKILVIIIGGAILAAGCSKSKNTPNPSSDSYLPVTSGSTWTYNDVVGGNTSQLTLTMTGGTTIFNSKTYYVGTSNSSAKGASTGYFYATNHAYAMRAAAAGITLELQMGNDAQNVGYTWTTTPSDNGTINGVSAKTVNTIKEKNITKVVNGKTFANVIHTQVDLQYDLGTGFQSVAVYDFYLAKGVGMIETDTSVSGTAYEVETITDYSVK